VRGNNVRFVKTIVVKTSLNVPTPLLIKLAVPYSLLALQDNRITEVVLRKTIYISPEIQKV